MNQSRKRKGEGKSCLSEALSLGLNPFQAAEKYGMTLRSVYALASRYKIKLPRKKREMPRKEDHEERAG